MQVRVTPRKKTAGRKETKNKTVKSRPEYPSTNVSSPIRPTKKNTTHYTYGQEDESDYYGAAPHPTRGHSRVRYDDDIVLAEDEDDEDYNEDSDFAPVREAKPPRQRTKQKTHGASITVDERLAGLNDLQKDILSDFMKGAKSLIQKIKLDKSLRFAPFPDTILREMCLDLPQNTEEMLSIPGINAGMVKLYGKSFLKLIKNSRAIFSETGCLPEPRHLIQRGRAFQGEEAYDEDDEERPADPNHRIEIDLCGDSDDDYQEAMVENESIVTMDDEDEDDDDGAVHTSHFFNHQVNPDVEAFNRQFSQAEATKPNPHSKASPAGRSTAPRAGSSRPPFKKKGGYRKRNSGNFGKSSYGGVSKRGGSKAPAARKPSGASGARKTNSGSTGNRRPSGGGGNSAWNSIMAMPT